MMMIRSVSSQRLTFVACLSIITCISLATLYLRFPHSISRILTFSSLFESNVFFLDIFQSLAFLFFGRMIFMTALSRRYLMLLVIALVGITIVLCKLCFPSWFLTSLMVLSLILSQSFRMITSVVVLDRLGLANIYVISRCSRRYYPLISGGYLIILILSLIMTGPLYEASSLLFFANIILTSLPILISIISQKVITISWLVIAGFSYLGITYLSPSSSSSSSSEIVLLLLLSVGTYCYSLYYIWFMFNESKEHICSIIQGLSRVCSNPRLSFTTRGSFNSHYTEIPSTSHNDSNDQDSEEDENDYELNLISSRDNSTSNSMTCIILDKWNVFLIVSLLFLSSLLALAIPSTGSEYRLWWITATKAWLDLCGWIGHWSVLYLSWRWRERLHQRYRNLHSEQLLGALSQNPTLSTAHQDHSQTAVKERDHPIYLV